MNNIVADNTVQSLKVHLLRGLSDLYSDREAGNIVHILFDAFNGWSRADLIMNSSFRLSESEMLRYHFALKRLIKGEPVQYITGYQFFLGKKFNVSPAVLIPRPETEELVQRIISTEKRTTPFILDIGTGSGCIAISLKLLKQTSRVDAIDISEEALEVAKGNALQHDTEIQFFKSDILHDGLEKKYDIIVSNPPYIMASERDTMRFQVTDFEPSLALFTRDDDALVFYKRIITLASQSLNPGGSLWFEIHENKGSELLAHCSQAGIKISNLYQDLQGKDRMLHIKFE